MHAFDLPHVKACLIKSNRLIGFTKGFEKTVNLGHIFVTLVSNKRKNCSFHLDLAQLNLQRHHFAIATCFHLLFFVNTSLKPHDGF